MKVLPFLGTLPVFLGAFVAAPAFAQNAAGAASFTLDASGNVIGASIAASVGEYSAMAVGISTSGGNSAYAIGASSLLSTPDWAVPAGSQYSTGSSGTGVGIVQIAISGGDVTFDMQNSNLAQSEAPMNAF